MVIPVCGHKDEGVDADSGRGEDQELVDLAPGLTERPGWGEIVVRCSEGDAEHDEEDVSNCQVQDQKVCGVLHVLVEADNEDHEDVSDEPNEYDDREEDWNKNGNNFL